MGTLEVNISMYRVGELGDCFLLQFMDSKNKSTVLIDCGSFRNGGTSVDRMKKIAVALKTRQTEDNAIPKPFDLVIGTHQHNDHLSGFVHAKDVFAEIGIQEVWLSWLDDPDDNKASLIAEGQRKIIAKLQDINALLPVVPIPASSAVDNLTSQNKKNTAADHISDILGFYGLDDPAVAGKSPVVPQKGINNLKELGKKVRYLSPGMVQDLPGMAPGAVKVYVLGPPRENDLLFDINPGKGESYDTKLTAALNVADGLYSALTNFEEQIREGSEEVFFPFDNKYSKQLEAGHTKISSYYDPASEWRMIDLEWLDQAEQLALYLDSYTNNSSLVLAFELVESQKVLLFVGDAQTGNWLSWKKITWIDNSLTLDILLKRTVLYKVGHHGSHNATLPEYLEKMVHPELVAMIPVDISDPNIAKKNGWRMPADNLYKHLKQQANFRILRMDNQYEVDCDPKLQSTHQHWGALLANVDDRPECVSYTIKG